MKIILASSSPRRKQILTEAGFSPDVLKLDTDESYDEQMPVEEVPLFLAKKKMAAAITRVNEPAIIITADTVVILENRIIGKPGDKHDAVEILKALSGKMHKVVSGVNIVKLQNADPKQLSTEMGFSVTTDVYFEELDDKEIEYYLTEFKPFDKAGAYAIQEWIGVNKISKIEGDYYNVVGLPMSKVYKILRSLK